MDTPFLTELIEIFALAIAVVLVCHRLHIPSIVGFLLTGIVSGPYGLQLIKGVSDVDVLARIGLILLLFVVGLEISFHKISGYLRYFFLGGSLQVSLTVLLGFSIAYLFVGRPAGEALFLGFLLSLSSTAIVLRLMQRVDESRTPHGAFKFGILIFQDVIVIPMMLLVPFLSSESPRFEWPSLITIGRGLAIISSVVYISIWLMPKLLDYVVRIHSHELFILTMITFCFAVAWVTSSIGLSLALGAFLAGLIISLSGYSRHASGYITPFQDVFVSFFFISIGMLLNLEFVMANLFTIFGLAFCVLLLKSSIIYIVAFVMHLSLRSATLSSLALSQVGEFSFVLVNFGRANGLGTDNLQQLFIAVAILTMGLTPFLLYYADYFLSALMKLPLPETIKSGLIHTEKKKKFKDHLIIIGFGFAGKSLARASAEAAIPYLILDINHEKVREYKKKAEPIFFGDATHEKVLDHVNFMQAKAIAVLINDPEAVLKIVEIVRHVNKKVFLIVRTHYLEEIQALYRLGADLVIPDELGSAVEIFANVLDCYKVSKEEIEKKVFEFRSEEHMLLQPAYSAVSLFPYEKLGLELEVKTVQLSTSSSLNGKKLGESQLRKRWGITVLMIYRKGSAIYKLDSETVLLAGDLLLISGTKKKNLEFLPHF